MQLSLLTVLLSSSAAFVAAALPGPKLTSRRVVGGSVSEADAVVRSKLPNAFPMPKYVGPEIQSSSTVMSQEAIKKNLAMGVTVLSKDGDKHIESVYQWDDAVVNQLISQRGNGTAPPHAIPKGKVSRRSPLDRRGGGGGSCWNSCPASQRTTPSGGSEYQIDSGLMGQYPESVIGLLQFSDQNGNAFTCSATLIAANVVLTAGHCVFLEGGWHSGFTFTAGDDTNCGLNGPYGSVGWSQAGTFTAWINNGGQGGDSFTDASLWTYDMGWVLLTQSVNGGYLGFGYGDSLSNGITNYGYPCSNAYYMMASHGTYTSPIYNGYIGQTNNVGCPGYSGSAARDGDGGTIAYGTMSYTNGLSNYNLFTADKFNGLCSALANTFGVSRC
ncbi:hypothetical protein DFJ73DRAFT_795360 [Zopfochytrium polystomum]|nr:hypothetical protein DFJ73DRAFT_795360 [Zopfochytrium polystomum]